MIYYLNLINIKNNLIYKKIYKCRINNSKQVKYIFLISFIKYT